MSFGIDELVDSLEKCQETATGPDDIPYRILKELSIDCLHVLLKLYSNIWKNGILPTSWKEATVIPIPNLERTIQTLTIMVNCFNKLHM